MNAPARIALHSGEEALADTALLALFRLRESLVLRNANSPACKVDEIMSSLEGFAREAVA